MIMHLKNVEKGYAEVYFEDKKCAGYVQLEEIVADVDLKKDELVTAKRWFAYKRIEAAACSMGWRHVKAIRVGRFNTGYETRKQAIHALALERGVDIFE